MLEVMAGSSRTICQNQNVKIVIDSQLLKFHLLYHNQYMSQEQRVDHPGWKELESLSVWAQGRIRPVVDYEHGWNRRVLRKGESEESWARYATRKMENDNNRKLMLYTILHCSVGLNYRNGEPIQIL